MTKLMFVCLGNICRSTMAEAVMKKVIEDKNLTDEYEVCSGGTSAEIGYGVHRCTYTKLKEVGINPNVYLKNKTAYQVKKEDYDKYDEFYCMDKSNFTNLIKIFGSDKENKVKMLLDRDISDPWYTLNFDETYDDVLQGIEKIVTKKARI